jgi:predicted dehydrogenase
MMTYRSGVIGCGRGGHGSAGGHSIGYLHGQSYQQHPDCELVAGVDLDPDNLAGFCQHFAVTGGEDLGSVLAEQQPDIVSICTYVGSHCSILEQSVAAGVRGIWCEKPFALSMEDAEAMVGCCQDAGVALVVNFQRRFLPVFVRARALIAAGTIGAPVLLTAGIDGWDAMEWGCHWLDMFHYLQGDARPEWVFGQARCSGDKRGYGHVMEEHSVSYLGYDNGARGLLDGGCSLACSAAIRVIGQRGMPDIHHDGSLEWWNDQGCQREECAGSVHGPAQGSPGLPVLETLVDWLDGGPEASVSAAATLDGTAAYLAAYESALRQDRIDWPLKGQTNFPLEELVERRRVTASVA